MVPLDPLPLSSSHPLPFSKLISTIPRDCVLQLARKRELMCCKRAFASVNQAENSLSALSAFSLIICIKNLLICSPDALLLIRAPRRRLKRHKGLCSLRHSGRHACCIDLSILSLHLSVRFYCTRCPLPRHKRRSLLETAKRESNKLECNFVSFKSQTPVLCYYFRTPILRFLCM